MKTTVYLVRHAQSNPSLKTSNGKWPLSAVGIEQSDKLSLLLRSLTFQKICSSPYIRCLKTIEPLALETGMEIGVVENLRERHISESLAENFTEVWEKSWIDFDFALPGCETQFTAQTRIRKALEMIGESNYGKTLVVCSHGNVIGLFLNTIDTTFGRFETEMLRNPDVVRVLYEGGKYSWDQDFELPGLKAITTDHYETPSYDRYANKPLQATRVSRGSES